MTPIVRTVIKIVASAFISGDIPNRRLEKTIIGSVVAPGPATKLAITTSSRDRANDKSHPRTMLGKIIGSVITKNTFSGDAPRSSAASSIDRSKSCKRAWTSIVT